MDLLLALLFGLGVVIAYYLVIALIAVLVPIVSGLVVFAVAAAVAYAFIQSRHKK